MDVYQICITLDGDETLQPAWVTVRVVEGGRHRGGVTQARYDIIPPFVARSVSTLMTQVEEMLLRKMSGIDGFQLEL